MPRELVEDKFRPLREEAERLTESFKGLVASLGRAAQGGSGPVPNAGGAVAAVNQLDQAQQRAAKSGKTLIVQAKEFTGVLGGLGRAVKGAGDIAKALGLESTSRQFEAVSRQINAVGGALGGLAAIGSALGAPFIAAVAAIAAATAAAGHYNSEINRILKLNAGLADSVRAGGLALQIQGNAEAVDSLREAARKLREEGPNLIQQLFGVTAEELEARANALADATTKAAAELQGLRDKAEQGLKLPDFFADPAGFMTNLTNQVRTALEGTFGPTIQGLLDQLKIRDLLTADSVARAKERIAQINGEIAKSTGDVAAQVEGIRAEAAAAIEPLVRARQLLARPVTGAGSDADRAERQARIDLIDQEIAATNRLAEARIRSFDADPQLARFQQQLTEIGDLVQNTLDFAIGAIQSFSATVSAAILDAFLDPQADIRESFANLFRALAQQILALLIQALAVRALSAVGLGVASQGGQVQAAAAGGKIVGLARGGFPFGRRPPGIPATDTVHAMLTPGEFVSPVASVLTYGAEFFEALRQRLIDPAAVEALMGGISIPRPRLVPRIGLASGGPVVAGGSGGSGQQTVIALVPPSEQTMENLIAGGAKALGRFVDQRARGRV